MQYGGWFQIAFERDLKDDLTSVRVGNLRLMCVKTEAGIEVYDAVCPHRGADLAVGGKLEGRNVACAYHGHRIALGAQDGGRFCVRRYRAFSVSGLVFALIAAAEEGDLPVVLAGLERTHQITPGFEKPMKVAPELVIENAFDADHFRPVHDVIEVMAKAPRIERGVFTVETTLRVGPSTWQGGENDGTFVDVPLLARAFSPNVTITQIALGGDHPHYVIAAGTPLPDGNSIVRLSVAMPRGADGSSPPPEVAQMILEYESFGLEQDRPVWENLTTSITPDYIAGDATVLAYRQFCKRFKLDAAPEQAAQKVSAAC